VLTAGATTWVVDPTPLGAASGRWPITSAVRCPAPTADAPVIDGQALQPLGVAVVVYSRKQGTMAWGHASVRVLYCLGGQVVDREYETYRLSAWNEVEVRRAYVGEAFLDGHYLREQRGALFLFRNEQAVDGGWIGDALAHNREVYTTWLDLDPAEQAQVVLGLEAWHADQLAQLRALAPLTERYRALSTNCTAVLQRTLPEIGGRAHLPFTWLRRAAPTGTTVLYPSHHLVKAWGGRPPSHVAQRPRPKFRRTAALDAETFEALSAVLDTAVPVLPGP
jgi:hypothetical protein